MSEFRKADSEYPYFLTLTVVGWIDVFTRSIYSDIIIRNLQYCINNKVLEVFAYALMPSHLHMIARSTDGALNNILRDFKGYSSKQIIKEIQENPQESRKDWLLHMFKYHAKYQKQNPNYMFWQKTNHPIILDTDEVFDQKEEYIRDNPVAAGYVNSPEYWYYSSACQLSPLSMSKS